MNPLPLPLRILALALAAGFAPAAAQAATVQPWYLYDRGSVTRWVSPENPAGTKGAGGGENAGAKGHAFETLPAGKSHALADIRGSGIIDRMWITIFDRTPEALRSLRLDIYWDGADTPAVSAPLGDFFGHGSGEMKTMENALFVSPEGRSFLCHVPMPFRTAARIVLTNESAREIPLLFYDVNYRLLDRHAPDTLYFHAWWSRDPATEPGRAFRILPRIEGRGRFLGTNVTVFTNPVYGKSWWGEGAVKVWLDGDRTLPTLVGTGTEDYVGTGWGQSAYVNRFQGAPVADEAGGRWTFYRFHIPDPIYFARDIEVQLQQIGGAPKAEVMKMQAAGAPLIPVTVDPGSRRGFRQLLAGDDRTPLDDPRLPDGWTNYYRSDDVSAVAYFYLDRPENGLPPIAGAAERTAKLRPPPRTE